MNVMEKQKFVDYKCTSRPGYGINMQDRALFTSLSFTDSMSLSAGGRRPQDQSLTRILLYIDLENRPVLWLVDIYFLFTDPRSCVDVFFLLKMLNLLFDVVSRCHTFPSFFFLFFFF